MDIGYERFAEILANKGIKAYRVAKDTGLSTVLFTDWKNGKSKPKYDKLKIISDYLGTTPEYLSGMDVDAPPSRTDDELARIALLGGLDSVSDAGWEEIKAYAQFVKAREHIDHK